MPEATATPVAPLLREQFNLATVTLATAEHLQPGNRTRRRTDRLRLPQIARRCRTPSARHPK
jgi:hypothetical protein